MKAGAKPELKAKWWKDNKGRTVKDVGLEKSLDVYERAALFLRTGETKMGYKAVLDSLKVLAPTVTKQIAACTKGVHTETIDALKRYEPLIKQTWAEVHQDSAKFAERIAQVEDLYDKYEAEIAKEEKKVRPARAEADRLIEAFPAACKKGKGKKAKAELERCGAALEKLADRFEALHRMTGQLKQVKKDYGVDGEARGDPVSLFFKCDAAKHDCEAKQKEITRLLGEFSDTDLEGLDATYIRKQKAITPVVIGLAGEVNSALGAARELTKHLSKIPDEATANKRLTEVGPHLETARRLRTQVNSTLRDLREFDDDDTPTGRALNQAKAKLVQAPEKVQQIEEVCKAYRSAIEERIAFLRQKAIDDQRTREQEQRRDAEATKAAAEYKKQTARWVATAKGWVAKAKGFQTRVQEQVRGADRDGARALDQLIFLDRELAARQRNELGKIIEDVPGSKLRQKQAATQVLIFKKLYKQIDDVYLQLDEMSVELRKIPGVMG